MKLSTILPKHSALNRSKFYDVGGGVKRLTLRIKHTVTGVVASKERIGEADIDYNFDFPPKGSFTRGIVVGEGPYVGVQSTDMLNNALDELRPRTNYAFGKVSKTMFDMRALSYALGAACAAGIGNVDFDVSANPSGYRTLGTGWSVPRVGDIILGPEIITTAKEFATLMSIAGEVGVRGVTVLRDDIPGVDGTHLVGRKLAAFAMRVQANILQASYDAMCYGAHKLAFECGKTAIMRLNSHTDEGGWVRGLMTGQTYPVPTGYVFGIGTHFGTLPLQETIMHEDIFRVVIGDYLEFVALFPVADVLVHGEHSVIEADTETPTRLNDYDLLAESIYHVFYKVRDLLCDLEGYHRDANDGGGSLANYILRNPADRHFGNSAIIPWWFVEPSPLLTKSVEGYWVPARHGEIIKLPLFKAATVRHVGNALDGMGRAGPGATSYIVRSKTSLREEGASYLLSARYCPENGLSQMHYVSESPAGDVGRIPMLVGNPADSIADNRWVTPHNPMANPMEGRADVYSVVRYRHVSKRTDLTPSEMLNTTVESSFGTFTVSDDSPTAVCQSHRDIPVYMRRRLKLTTACLTPLVSMGVVTFGNEGTFGVGEPGSDDPMGVAPLADAPGGSGTQAQREEFRATEEEPVLPSVTPGSEDLDEDLPQKPAVQPSELPDTPEPEEEGPTVPIRHAPLGVKPAARTVKAPAKQKDDESGNGPSIAPRFSQESPDGQM